MAKRLLDALGAEDDAAGREVRALDKGHQLFEPDLVAPLPVVDHKGDGVGDLGQVVGRHVGRHTDGDAAGAVDEQVGQHGREHGRLFEAVVEVGAPVDRVHVDVGKHGVGDAGEAGLGVTHGGGAVAVDRAEVALAVDQRIAQAEVLRHARHGVIDGGVAVGVVLTQHLADDTGAFLVRSAWVQAHIVHGVEDAAVHRLEAVARIREGAGHDHAHGVIEVGGAHLLFDQHGPHVAAAADAVVAIGAVRAIHAAAAAALAATMAPSPALAVVGVVSVIRQAALQVVAFVVKDIVEVLGDRALACIIKLVHGLVLQLVVQLVRAVRRFQVVFHPSLPNCWHLTRFNT